MNELSLLGGVGLTIILLSSYVRRGNGMLIITLCTNYVTKSYLLTIILYMKRHSASLPVVLFVGEPTHVKILESI